MSMMTGTGTRRQKWQYPQPPTPRILYLPGRNARRKASRAGRPSSGDSRRDRKDDTKLEALFEEEREFLKGGEGKGGGGSVPVVLFGDYDDGEMRRREGSGGDGAEVEEEEEEDKWRFQAEVLRAECNLLRMEKEIAVRKLDRSRVYLERTLRSAIEALVSGRKKIGEGKNIATVLEEEIQNLVDELKELGKGSRAKDTTWARNCSNFDRQVTVLQRRLDKLGSLSEGKRVEKIRKMAEESLSMSTSSPTEVKVEHMVSNGDSVEILRRKMEGLSKDMLLVKMEEEYDSILSTADSSVSSSASTSNRVECLGHYVPFIRQANQERSGRKEGAATCSGHCKAVVRRIVEQVRAETEQWSQLQDMLGQVRDEMQELQASRDFWEDRALSSNTQNQSLHSAVQQWRQRALSSEAKVTELQLKVSLLRDEIDSLKKDLSTQSMSRRNSLPLAPSPRNETEKRVLVCSLKENHQNGLAVGFSGIDRRRKVHSCSSSRRDSDLKKSPLRDIGNSSQQNAKLIFPLSCHLSSN
ncbi:uncharacterized protein LOC116210392 [Punica granatum]|uniref:Uncharacterized protein n=2 Tax=Punica granatum TaxID=22663 RepID=A0A218W9K2_PUNGR|nr:uncharacterized protein LOC116210392 [Punica granatum]OWM69179.1 hypothetical protein CDL15_Pgr025366 [Punica granatum]PKI42491.1 hypothetical protein CRG98_037080 [Punica granatum]